MTAIVELESWLIYQCIVTECNNCLFMTESAFRARDIGLRAQKKILSRMAGKNIARVFIDDTTASLLDNVYRLAKQYSNNKKEAEKLVKNVIKVTIKLGVLHRNGAFGPDELRQAERLRARVRTAGMAVVSFYEVDHTYDRAYLAAALRESRDRLRALVAAHLSEKSRARVDAVFAFLADDRFLDACFRPGSELREPLGRVVADLNRALENGDL